MVRDTAAAASTARYAKKREAIVAAATDVLNRQGVKGMTLAEVAAQVDLNTTSVTYYFRKKEDLAAACFLAGIERITDMIREALRENGPRARIAKFTDLFFQRHALRRGGEGAPLVQFLDIRTLEEPHLSIVNEAYAGMVRGARDLFSGGDRVFDRNALHARTYLLLEHVFWSASWLTRYDVEDYPRIRDRLIDVMLEGFAAKPGAWSPRLIGEDQLGLPEARDTARETFLIASTRLINRLGYRGASVEKISAELNVTKGSFYHHNEAKDELVVACFDRTHDLVRQVQHHAMADTGSAYTHLADTVATLVQFQNSDRGPLLRTLALGALPEPMKASVTERSLRITDRFGAMIADGVTDGSIRAIDPAVGAHMLKIALNAAAEFSAWVRGADRAEAVALMAKPTMLGLLCD